MSQQNQSCTLANIPERHTLFKLLSYFLLTMLDNNVEQVVYPYFHTAVTCVNIYQIEDISNEPGLQMKAFYCH
jgi:DNA-directed RNA polymerase subunit L